MMAGPPYVLDASMGIRDGMFCFCPAEVAYEDDEIIEITSVVTGLTYLGPLPPENARLIAIVHDEGQEAVEAFCEAHAAVLDAMNEAIEARAKEQAS